MIFARLMSSHMRAIRSEKENRSMNALIAVYIAGLHAPTHGSCK